MSHRTDEGGVGEAGPEDGIRPRVVLLAAFRSGEAGVDETTHWLARHNFRERFTIPGVDNPVFFDPDRNVALAVTGIGNVEAAVTVNALLASTTVECGQAYFISVGSAGTPPNVGTLGSVFINDRIVDWDQKHRLSPVRKTLDTAPTRPFSFKRAEEVCKVLNPGLVAAARDAGTTVDLVDSPGMWAYRYKYPFPAARSPPSVAVGTSVSGSEFWHGSTCSHEAQQLVDAYNAGTYCTTEMEGFGTAVALERHDLLDRYVSIRGISNFDRPYPGQPPHESVEQNVRGLSVCMENVYRVGSSMVSRIVDDWERWLDGVPVEVAAVSA